MRKSLLFIGTLLIAFTIGAAAGTKITAELQNKSISYNGNLSSRKVISYKGSTYVPLKEFSTLTNISLDIKNGVIYLGENNTVTAPAPVKQKEQLLRIDSVSIGEGFEKESVVLNVNFKNNSGKTMSPSETGYGFIAYQNGISLNFNYIPYSDGNTSSTLVMDGHELNFISEFEINDHSPIIVETYDEEGKKINTQTFKLE